eukprot:c11068_g1_i4.p1 GENE.c11068_g1_i4~~c11068_g1_i4.p1  ORF type:complete len:155 (+),score=32.64 c11068_g1_i4:82-546(+)
MGKPKQPTNYRDKLEKGMIPSTTEEITKLEEKVKIMEAEGTLPTIHTDCEAYEKPPGWWNKNAPEYMTAPPKWALHGLAKRVYKPYEKAELFLETDSATSAISDTPDAETGFSNLQLLNRVTELTEVSNRRIRTLEHIVQATHHLVKECHGSEV